MARLILVCGSGRVCIRLREQQSLYECGTAFVRMQSGRAYVKQMREYQVCVGLAGLEFYTGLTLCDATVLSLVIYI